MIHLRPSASPTWVPCSASARFALECREQPTTDAAREGQAAAWVAEVVLSGNALRAFDLDGETHESGWLVDTNMCSHVQGYVDKVQARGGRIEAEKFVRLNEFIGGTLDSAAMFVEDRKLYVDDLKFGYGIVEPTTPQIVIYAEALCRELESQGDNIDTVILGIYQPRANHPDGIHRTRFISREELAQEAEKIIQRGHDAQHPNSVATPGDHCKHCPAATSCEALGKTLLNVAEIIESQRRSDMTASQLAVEGDFLEQFGKLYEARRAAWEAETEHRIANSEFVPGWAMQSGSGRRRFKTGVTPETIKALTGINPTKEVNKSPAEIEKDGNAATKKVVKFLAETPPTKRKLKRAGKNTVAKQFETKGY